VLTLRVAEYAAATSIRAIPGDVIERAKLVIFDELACACFGRRSLAGDLAARYAAAVGGSGESRVLGTELRAAAPYAALANGTAGHGEEVDGAHVVWGHPGATLVNAAKAMAERLGAKLVADRLSYRLSEPDLGTLARSALDG